MTTTYVKTLITDESLDQDSPGTETAFLNLLRSVNYLIDFVFNGAANSSGLTTVAGDYYLAMEEKRQVETGATYAKHHEVQVWRPGAYRVYFEGLGSGSAAYYRVYKNGVAAGTERNPGGAAFVAYTEDLTGLVKGDLIQLYTHGDGGGNVATSRRFAVGVTAATADGISHTIETSDTMDA